MKTRRIKTGALDKLFSRLIRERSGWRCEKCFTQYEPNARGLHCSHFHGRRKQSVRFDPVNCFSHCYFCHQKLGENPHDFREWTWKTLGAVAYEELLQRANTPLKRTEADKQELYEKMRLKLDWMESERATGNMGRLEFEL